MHGTPIRPAHEKRPRSGGGARKEENKVIRVADEQALAILNDLVTFVHRVATSEQASAAEVTALPEIAKILPGHTSIYD